MNAAAQYRISNIRQIVDAMDEVLARLSFDELSVLTDDQLVGYTMRYLSGRCNPAQVREVLTFVLQNETS